MKLGFQPSQHDECVFYYGKTVFIVYTDDTILLGPDKDVNISPNQLIAHGSMISESKSKPNLKPNCYAIVFMFRASLDLKLIFLDQR